MSVSIIMPIYNSAKYLPLAIDSLLEQSYADIEINLINNGSTDQSMEICLSYMNRDDRVRCFNLDAPDLIGARNFGIEKSTHDYIAFLDSDDICLPDRLTLQTTFLDKNEKVSILGGQSINIDESGLEVGVQTKNPLDDLSIKNALQSGNNPFVNSSIVARKSTLLSLGGYRRAFVLSEDYDLWKRASHNYCFANVEKPVVKYRQHGSSVSAKKISQLILFKLFADFCYQERTLGFTDPADRMSDGFSIEMIDDSRQREIIEKIVSGWDCLFKLSNDGKSIQILSSKDVNSISYIVDHYIGSLNRKMVFDALKNCLEYSRCSLKDRAIVRKKMIRTSRSKSINYLLKKLFSPLLRQ